MTEEDLFHKIFIENVQVEKYPKQSFGYILKTPTFNDWKQFLEKFKISKGIINFNKNQWLKIVLCHDKCKNKIINYNKFDIDCNGLYIFLLLSKFTHNNDLYRAVFNRIIKIMSICCELAADIPVMSPPVINLSSKSIHPGNSLVMAAKILDIDIPVLLVSPVNETEFTNELIVKSESDQFQSLNDILKMYHGSRIIGFFEKDDNDELRHLNICSFHSKWNQIAKNGYAIPPKFLYEKFFELINDSLNSFNKEISFNDKYDDKIITLKITDDLDLLKPIFKEGYSLLKESE